MHTHRSMRVCTWKHRCGILFRNSEPGFKHQKCNVHFYLFFQYFLSRISELLMEWLSFNKGNYLRCYIVWLTAHIAFTKVGLALVIVHKAKMFM